MLPDWGYGRVYTVVVVNCTFAREANAGGRLVLHAHYGPPSPPDRSQRIVALQEPPGTYDAAAFRSPPHLPLLRLLAVRQPQLGAGAGVDGVRRALLRPAFALRLPRRRRGEPRRARHAAGRQRAGPRTTGGTTTSSSFSTTGCTDTATPPSGPSSTTSMSTYSYPTAASLRMSSPSSSRTRSSPSSRTPCPAGCASGTLTTQRPTTPSKCPLFKFVAPNSMIDRSFNCCYQRIITHFLPPCCINPNAAFVFSLYSLNLNLEWRTLPAA
jgi:hypothetical protein